VAQDHNVPISVISQIPFFMLFPDTDASRCIRSIALKLVRDPLGKSMPMELFWDRCLGFLSPQYQAGSGIRDRKESAGQTPGEDQTTVSAVDSQADLKERMSSLENKISLLLEGMDEIKVLLRGKRFETKETDKNNATAPLSCKPAPPSPELIPLDFEAWIKEQSV
jgi:flagellar biosynthesis protein FlhG